MSNLFIKNRVPDGSKFCLSLVEGEGSPAGSFVGSARLVMDSGSEEVWSDAQVHPGPKCKTLTSPKSYAWRIRVAFTSSGTQRAVITGEITKPDGTPFGQQYRHEVTGKNGDIRRATIILATEKPA